MFFILLRNLHSSSSCHPRSPSSIKTNTRRILFQKGRQFLLQFVLKGVDVTITERANINIIHHMFFFMLDSKDKCLPAFYSDGWHIFLLCIYSGIIGNIMAEKTVCMNARQTDNLHYNVHSLYGWSQSRVTLEYVSSVAWCSVVNFILPVICSMSLLI